MGTNSVTLQGNLVREPMVKELSSATLARFTLAINKKVGDKEYTDFVPCVAWNGLANVATSLTQGAQVTVIGSITTRSYEDKDGRKVYVTEVRADSLSAPMTSAPQATNFADFGADDFGGTEAMPF